MISFVRPPESWEWWQFPTPVLHLAPATNLRRWFESCREHFYKDIRIKLALTTNREDSWETISLFSLEINCIVCSLARPGSRFRFWRQSLLSSKPWLEASLSQWSREVADREGEREHSFGRVQMHFWPSKFFYCSLNYRRFLGGPSECVFKFNNDNNK